MSEGFRFPKVVISSAAYLYHRFLLSYRDVQELLFKRGVDVSHETVRAWLVCTVQPRASRGAAAP